MIRPLKDRLVVRRFPPKEKSGVIFLPNSAQEECNQGEVIAIGPKVSGVLPGDIVHFGPFVDYERDGLVMIQEADIRLVGDHAR